MNENKNKDKDLDNIKRPYKPDHVPGLLPHITIADGKKAIEFYETAFHFQLDGEPMEKEGRLWHFEMCFMENRLMFAEEGAFGSTSRTPNSSKVPSPIQLYLYCEDVDSFYENALKMGATSRMEPQNTFWGDRVCKLSDPDGHEWSFATNVADFDPLFSLP